MSTYDPATNIAQPAGNQNDVGRTNNPTLTYQYERRKENRATEELREEYRNLNKLESGKIVVLSFRQLQLQRISALQRQLFELQAEQVGAMVGKRSSLDNLNEDIDVTLSKYGKCLP